MILLKTAWHIDWSMPQNVVIQGPKDSKEPHKIELQIVIHHFTNGFNKSFTAQAFGATTKMVRKLVGRYKQ